MCHRLCTPILSEAHIQQSLEFTQQLLLNAHVPSLLRFTYYLKVCCMMINRVEWALQSREQKSPSFLRSSSLLQALASYDQDWWKKCYITEAGLLQSDDPALYQLLEPIATFQQNLPNIYHLLKGTAAALGNASLEDVAST